jgi:hypothetical protein
MVSANGSGGSTTLSVTGGCRGGTVMSHHGTTPRPGDVPFCSLPKRLMYQRRGAMRSRGMNFASTYAAIVAILSRRHPAATAAHMNCLVTCRSRVCWRSGIFYQPSRGSIRSLICPNLNGHWRTCRRGKVIWRRFLRMSFQTRRLDTQFNRLA